IHWRGVRFSPIFSAQRCREPICGSTSETISPSGRSTSRSTPWGLGGCGPMLTSISSVRTSNSTTRGSSSCRGVTLISNASASDVRFPVIGVEPYHRGTYVPRSPGYSLPVSDPVVLQRHLVVLPQRMADPVFGAEDAVQVGMADEIHSGKV